MGCANVPTTLELLTPFSFKLEGIQAMFFTFKVEKQATPVKLELNLHDGKMDGVDVYWCFSEKFPGAEEHTGYFHEQ